MYSASGGNWSRQIFVISWLAYASFYLCRKNFSVMIPLLMEEEGFSRESLAHVVFAFSVAYAAGQFLMGALTDRYGPRLMVTLGMLLSAAAMGLVGASRTVLWLILFQMANGLAQASGWSGLVKLMGNWFTAKRRGITMAWWSTNYVLGGFLATTLATGAGAASLLGSSAARRVAWAPAVVFALMALVFVSAVRNSPREAGLPEVPQTPLPEHRHQLEGNSSPLENPCFPPLAAAYFCVKLIRYTLSFWLPLYLIQELSFLTTEAGYLSGTFELAGVLGVLAAGYLSDGAFQSRRFPVGALMLLALAAVAFCGPLFTPFGRLGAGLYLAFLGIFTYGPDTLLVGAAAQDVSSRGRTGTAVGTVDGIGSIGILISPYLVSMVVSSLGWTGLLRTLGVLALIAAGILFLGIPRERAFALTMST